MAAVHALTKILMSQTHDYQSKKSLQFPLVVRKLKSETSHLKTQSRAIYEYSRKGRVSVRVMHST